MKIKTPDLRSHFNDISRLRRAIESKLSEQQKLEDYIQALRRKIDGVSDIDYRNDAAVRALSTAQTRLSICEKNLVASQQEMERLTTEECEIVCQPISDVLTTILTPTLNQYRDEIAALLDPYCSGHFRALEIAGTTCAATHAHNAFNNLRALPGMLHTRHDPQQVIEGLEKLEVVLAEALNPESGLVQFIMFPSAAQRSRSVSANAKRTV